MQLEEQLDSVDEQLNDLPDQVAVLDAVEHDLDQDTATAQQIRRTAAAAGVLDGLLSRMSHAQPHRAEIATLPAEIARQFEELSAAQLEETRADTAAGQALTVIHARREALKERRSERAVLDSITPATPASPLPAR
jgi:hypothetical protein